MTLEAIGRVRFYLLALFFAVLIVAVWRDTKRDKTLLNKYRNFYRDDSEALKSDWATVVKKMKGK